VIRHSFLYEAGVLSPHQNQSPFISWYGRRSTGTSHAAKYESVAARKLRSVRSARYSSVSDSQSRTRSNHAWSVVSVARG
jgi:hypothetical protein